MSKKLITTNSILYNSFTNLNNVYRFSNTYIINKETTAEHTIKMQLIALYLYNEYSGININDLIMRILYHDLDEMVLCDIPRDIKYFNADSKKLIDKISEDKLKAAGVLTSIISRIQNAKHDGTLNGELCQVIDVLQCTYKLYSEYLLQGTKVITTRLIEAIEGLDLCLEKYKALIDKYTENPNDIHISNNESVVSHKDVYELLRKSCNELESLFEDFKIYDSTWSRTPD